MPVELLKGDGRFNTGALTDAEKSKLFVSFVEEFTSSRMRLFLAKLNTLPCEKLSSTFDEVLEELQTNKRLFDGLPQADLLSSYEQWKRSKSKELKEAFVLFLRQNPDVSRGTDEDGEKFASLLEKLQKDVRYQRLDYIPDERLELVKQRIREVNMECARKPPIAAAKQQNS
ncbi:ff domain protein [Cystoisospora suis]|uniref:Ff domain protein n=1 Tax=Cystoisospora suis TaxID=483139 RepID=A0A2C6KIV0_9APIC|nr:ff domain protein [Cystoisospora suis]